MIRCACLCLTVSLDAAIGGARLAVGKVPQMVIRSTDEYIKQARAARDGNGVLSQDTAHWILRDPDTTLLFPSAPTPGVAVVPKGEGQRGSGPPRRMSSRLRPQDTATGAHGRAPARSSHLLLPALPSYDKCNNSRNGSSGSGAPPAKTSKRFMPQDTAAGLDASGARFGGRPRSDRVPQPPRIGVVPEVSTELAIRSERVDGAPGRNRTCYLMLRRHAL